MLNSRNYNKPSFIKYRNKNTIIISSHLQFIKRTHLAVRGEATNSAILAIRARANLGGLLATRVALVAVAVLALVLARVDDLAGVAIVGVDAAEDTAVDGNRVLDDDVAGTAVVLAVSAAAGELAVVLGVWSVLVEVVSGR